MSLPESITILGQPFAVRLVPRGELPRDGDMATSDLRRQLIRIVDDHGPTQERDTVLHEVLHMVARMADLEERKLDERAINVFSTVLLDVLRRNPRLVEYLADSDAPE